MCSRGMEVGRLAELWRKGKRKGKEKKRKEEREKKRKKNMSVCMVLTELED